MAQYPTNNVRKLVEDEIDEFVEIYKNAYPGEELQKLGPDQLSQLKTRWKKVNDENPSVNFYGCFRGEKLVGGMLLFDFTMNIFSNMVDVGGVGMVCVDLLHKKEHVAKELMQFFHSHYYSRESCLTTLYPFRPDFYKKMGYGIGNKFHQFSFTPDSSTTISRKDHITTLTTDDNTNLLDFYTEYVKKNHGMILRTDRSIQRLLGTYNVIGFKQNESINGYLAFKFKKGDPDNFILNDLIIDEFLYDSPVVFQELMTFINTQYDQIRRIILNTYDGNFHFSLADPRNGSPAFFRTAQETNISGVGVMYRVLNVRKLFEILKNHNFGSQTLKLKLALEDSFLPENSGNFLIAFTDGSAKIEPESSSFDAAISMNISSFSSLIMGVIPFRELFIYGLATISDERFVDKVNKTFLSDTPPVTIEQF